MARGPSIEWTRELLEELVALDGAIEHVMFANRLEMKVNTVYSIKSRVKWFGGIDEFLERNTKTGPPRTSTRRRVPRGIYFIHAARSAGRGDATQWTVTIPFDIAEKYVEEHGREVEWERRGDELVIRPSQRSRESERRDVRPE